MPLSVGIVGLPNVGKSTLFNALTKKGAETANYPFCTIDPSVGVVTVPDARIDKLGDFSRTKKRIPAVVEFVDIAGLVKGASEGEGLGNKFLANIRETDAIGEVVRIFDGSDVIHIDGKIDPVHDIAVINLELILADLQTVTKRIENIGKDVKRGDKLAIKEVEIVGRIKEALLAEKLANTILLTEDELPIVKQLNLLTAKPFLYILNKMHGGTNLDELKDERWDALMQFLESNKFQYVIIDAKIEEELNAFDGAEKQEMKEGMGVSEDGINDLIVAAYKLLGLVTYFTTGEMETRAWTIKKDSTAPVAGMAIHTDFKEKFIRAEVIYWEDLIISASYGNARDKGLLRTEGKEYVVKDGDVIEFRI